MTHITFIHGIANKPEKEKLHEQWKRQLNHDDMFDLGAMGVTTSFVYWADVLYEKPLDEEESKESIGLEKTGGETVTQESDEDSSWIESLPDEQKAKVNKLRERLGIDTLPPDGDDMHTAEPYSTEEDGDNATESGVSIERVPLPWFVKRRILEKFLKDVHHYLFNTRFEPRPGDVYQVKDEIQKRFVETLTKDSENNTRGNHVVVSHSMGTVIAYDCLKHLNNCPEVDGLMTVGSPLGLDEIQDMMPDWTRENGYPDIKLSHDWSNIYDRLDPVAGFDAKLANDYRHENQRVIDDQRVKNTGRWRHSSWKYFKHDTLRETLRSQLGL